MKRLAAEVGGGPEAVAAAPAHPLRARRLLLGGRADAHRLRVGLPPGAARGRDDPARPRERDRPRHLRLDPGDQRPAGGAAGRQCRGRADAPLGPRQRPRGARPLRHRPSGLGPARADRALQPHRPAGAGGCRPAHRPHRRDARILRRPDPRGRADRLPSRQRHRPAARGTAHPRGRRPAGRPAAGARHPGRRGAGGDRGRDARDRRRPLAGQAHRRRVPAGRGRHLLRRPRDPRRRDPVAGRRQRGVARGPDGLRRQRPLGRAIPPGAERPLRVHPDRVARRLLVLGARHPEEARRRRRRAPGDDRGRGAGRDRCRPGPQPRRRARRGPARRPGGGARRRGDRLGRPARPDPRARGGEPRAPERRAGEPHPLSRDLAGDRRPARGPVLRLVRDLPALAVDGRRTATAPSTT